MSILADFHCCSFLYRRQLLKDFDKYCFAGFLFAAVGLPVVLAKKEDILSREEVTNYDEDGHEDPEAGAAADSKFERGIRNEPQIKVMVGGTFVDMLKRGVFKPL